MKAIKLTKKMLKMHPADLLIKLGVVHENKYAYPQHVYFSKQDYKTLKNNLKSYAKKKLQYASTRMVDYSVNCDLLNYGPNETLANAIKPGYALIDWDSVEKEKKESNGT